MPPLIHRDRDAQCWLLVHWRYNVGIMIARMATDHGDPRQEVVYLRTLDRLLRMCPETPQDGPGRTFDTGREE